MLQTNTLAAKLKERYGLAPSGGKVVAVYLFGIEFSDALAGKQLNEICADAEISIAYATELAKARKLAAFVELKT